MSIALVVNGVTYNYPTDHQTAGWGAEATGWAEAVTNGLIPKIGGTFTLTGEVDFGATFGFKLAYLKSQGANISTSGVVRLANTETIAWRNAGNSANLPLTVNSNNELTFNGEKILLGNDPVVNPDNVVTVQPNPGENQFSSIKDAVDYVAANGSPSGSNSWLVLVNPGEYVEDPITVVSGIHVISESRPELVIVTPTDADDTLFTLESFTSLVNISPKGCNGTSTSTAIVVQDAYAVNLVGLKPSSNSIDFDISSTSTFTGVLLQDVILEQADTSRIYGVKVSSGAAPCQFIIKGGFALDQQMVNTNLIAQLYITGTLAVVTINGYSMSGFGTDGTGVIVSDGGTIRGTLSIDNYDSGIVAENVGAAPIIEVSTVISRMTISDINIAHPGTAGFISGSADKSQITVNSSAPISLSVNSTGATDKGFVSTGSLWVGSTFNNSTDIIDSIQQSSPIGLLSGGHMTPGTGTTVDITAGYGYVQDATTLKLKRVSWGATNLSVPNNAFNFVYINNAGVPSHAAAQADELQTILLGRTFVAAGAVSAASNYPHTALFPTTYIDIYLREAIGPIFGSGCVTTEGSTAFTLNVTNGNYFFGKTELTPTGGTPVSLLTSYHVGGVNFLNDTPTTIVNSTQYDDGTDLVNLGTGKYVKHMLMLGSDFDNDQRFILVTGLGEYDTLLEAEAADLPIPPSYLISSDQPLPPLAAIIIQEGESNIVEIFDLRPRVGFQSPVLAGTSNHGNLTGLLDDDHPQYLLVDGTRDMTGDLDMGTNDIINVGLVDGVDVSAHASRHLPNGADPLTTAAGTTVTLSTVNGVGTANSLSRSDHTHALTGVQPLDATLTALAAYNTNGILTQTAADTFTGRTITGTSNRVSITNGNGVAGNPTIDIDAAYVGQTSITTLGTITTGTWTGTVIGAIYGGTGQTSYTLGDILYSSATNTLSKLSGNTTTTRNFLRQTGTGAVSAAPAWDTVTATDVGLGNVENTALSTWAGTTNITTLGTITTGTWNGTVIGPTYGGTGVNNGSRTITLGGNLVTSGAFNTTLTVTADTNVTLPTSGTLVNTAVTTLSSLVSIGTITTGVWNGTQIGAIYGGTNQTSYTTGDMLYASATNTLSKLAGVATGNALISGGVSTAPSWGKIGLTTHISGTLGPTNGGTGMATYVLGDIIYSNGTNSLGALAGNITTNRRFLRQTGNGSISAVPVWDSVTATDVGLGNVANVDTTNASNISSGTLNSARLDATLTALAAYNTNGILVQTAADTFAGRTLTSTSDTLTITNADGVAGNPTLDVANNLIVGGTSAITIPTGTTAERSGSPADGMVRYNTTEDILEGYAAPYSMGQSPTAFQRTILYRKRRTFTDDFLGSSTTANSTKSIGELGWSETSSATPTNADVAAIADHVGIFQCTTGGAIGNNVRIHLGRIATSTVIMANQVEYFAFLFNIPTITTVTSLFGIGQDISSTTFGTAGVWFQFASATSASLQFITRSASTSATAVNTVTVVAGTWYLCEAFYNGSTWTPHVNGTAYTAQSTNIPSVATNAGYMVQTGVAATRSIQMDMFSMMTTELGNRY